MAEEILHNSPALHALKRHQLVSLSKRYGLRASGKNVDMISRLKEYASNLTPTRQIVIPSPAPTPAMSCLSDFAIDAPASPTPIKSQQTSPTKRRWSKGSDHWEVLSESGASLISPAKDRSEMVKSASVRSWKSAGNGEPLAEFGDQTLPLGVTSESSSTRSLASLGRRVSRHLMSRSNSASSRLDLCDDNGPEEPHAPAIKSVAYEAMDDCPPSPASTVGVPRRRWGISLLERPSTIRLCSPTPIPAPTSTAQSDELPFFSPNGIKERRSMAPIRSSLGASSSIHTRQSMPALRNAGSAHIANIYPPLPVDIPPVPPIPGAYKAGPSSPEKPFGFSVSNAQFFEAAQKVMEDMQAKMQARGIGTTTFGEELLKGKRAEVSKLVNTNRTLGEGGWGLRNMASSSSIQDRYAAAHEREFARMTSIGQSRSKPSSQTLNCSTSTANVKAVAAHETLDKAEAATPVPALTPGKRKLSTGSLWPSAPNGAPATGQDERQTKRKRLSAGPNGFGSLREAGKSLVNLLGDGTKAPASTKKKPRSSLTHGRGFAARFARFRTKRIEASNKARPTQPTSSAFTTPLPTSRTMPSLHASTTNPAGTHTVRSSTSVLSMASHVQSREARDRGRSTSAQTVASASSSRTPKRLGLPEFGGAPPVSRSGSVNALGLPVASATSLSSNASMKKKSQVDLIRNARPAPAPPGATSQARVASGASTSSLASTQPRSAATMKRSSTLHLPTASSLARKQATVKPPGARPLPAPPVDVGAPLPGKSLLRDTSLGTAANVPFPAPSTIASKAASRMVPPASPYKSVTPKKAISAAAARVRDRTSGLSAVKSKGTLKSDADVAARRAEIKAKQQRIGEERELRAMLGGGDVNMDQGR